VIRIVATGTVGSRKSDVQFLLVVSGPGKVELALADVHDAGPITREFGSELYGLVSVAARRQEDVIGAGTAGQRFELGLGAEEGRFAGNTAGHGTGPLGEVATLLRNVDTDYSHAGGAQDLQEDLTDEPQTNDTGGLTQPSVGLAEALHRDRADGGEGRVQLRDMVGHRNAQVLGHPVVLGVERKLVAAAGDTLADLEFSGTLTHGDDGARQRVTERRVTVEPVHHFLISRDWSELRNRLDDFLDLV